MQVPVPQQRSSSMGGSNQLNIPQAYLKRSRRGQVNNTVLGCGSQLIECYPPITWLNLIFVKLLLGFHLSAPARILTLHKAASDRLCNAFVGSAFVRPFHLHTGEVCENKHPAAGSWYLHPCLNPRTAQPRDTDPLRWHAKSQHQIAV